MKQKGLLWGMSILLLVGVLLPSCKADVDMKDLDTSMDLKLGLALPVGSFTASVGDFLGTGSIASYIGVDENGRLFYSDTMDMSREFYKIDLANYWADVDGKLDLKSRIMNVFPSLPSVNPTPLPSNQTFSLDFPIEVSMQGVNTKKSEERIDKIWVEKAEFTLTFDIEGLGVPFKNIESVYLLMDENFEREAGNKIDLDLTGKGFGQPIPIVMDEFYFNFMENKEADPSDENVVSSIGLKFVFVINTGNGAELYDDAVINYNFKISLMEYHAIWGNFKPSDQMYDEDTIVLAEEWADWKTLAGLKLPFSDPKITLGISHSIGVPLQFMGNYLYVTDAEGNRRDATFSGKSGWKHIMYEYVGPNEPIETVVHDSNPYTFDSTSTKGNIDRLFQIHPEYLAYKFSVTPLTDAAIGDNVKSFRLTENTYITIDAVIVLPLQFGDSVDVSYAGDVKTDLSMLAIDSLVSDINAVEELSIDDLKLFVIADNSIPFKINCTLEFRDSLDKVLPLTLDKLEFDAPNVVDKKVVQAQRTPKTIDLTAEQIDLLAQARTIHFICELGENDVEVVVQSSSSLKLTMALAADVSAALDLFN